MGLAALLGWIIGSSFLTSFGYPVPMAPSTALLFVLMGLSAAARARFPDRKARYVGVSAVGGLVTLAALLLLLLSLLGIRSDLEHLGIPISGMVAGVPAGYISPLTAGFFLLAGISLLLAERHEGLPTRRAPYTFFVASLLALGSYILVIAYLLGTPLLAGGTVIPPAFPTSVAFLFLGTSLASLSVPRLLTASSLAGAPDAPRAAGLVLIFLALVVGIISASSFYFRTQEKGLRAHFADELAAIAELKVGQIVRWRNGALSDAGLFYANADFSSLVSRLLAAPDDATRFRLESWIGKFRDATRYERVRLYERGGAPLLLPGSNGLKSERLPPDLLARLLRMKQVVLRDFYRDDGDAGIYLGLLVPVFAPGGTDVLAVLELRIDPEAYLYPMIKGWPAPSRTGETLLVRRDGADVLFLNELRFQNGSALNLRFPLSREQLPAAQAVLGKEGIFEGIDYRGVPVLSALRPVPGSPWFLVARLDVSEVLEPLKVERRKINVLILSLLVGAAGAAAAVWRGQHARFLRERLSAGEALRASEQRFSIAFRSRSVFMAITTRQGAFIEVNEFAVSFLGYAAEELIGRTLSDVGIPADEEADARIRRVIEGAGSARATPAVLRAKDGTRRDGLLSVEVIDIGGAPHLLLIMTDVTALKEAERSVIRLNRIYAMLRQVNQAISRIRELPALYDRACRVATESGGFLLTWIGLVSENQQGLRIAHWAGVDDRFGGLLQTMRQDGRTEDCPLDAVLRGGQPLICEDLEATACGAPCQEMSRALGARSIAAFPLRVSDRTRGVISFHAVEPGFFDEGEVRLLEELAMDISLAVDISDMEAARTLAEAQREKMEAQLLHAQRMEAVGRLAGGVAHDFNNMLQVINSYADLLLAKLDPTSPLRAHVQQISLAGKRSADLTKQLLAFARKQVIDPKELDLNEAVSGVLNMLGRLLGEDIDLTWRPADMPLPVHMDPAQIDQVLANLVVNSRDAISGNGMLTIETGEAHFDQAYCETHAGFRPGRYAMLAVSDDGSGMDKETMSRIFEPFFTTKPQGKGTGLGLASVYGIVKQSDGFINVYSEPGKGTTFRIYLPWHEAGGAGSGAEHVRPEIRTGTETLLLVEDEPGIVELGERMLRELGYSVLAAAAPREAIRLATEHPGEIHLLVSDVIMPQMSGIELWRKLQEIRPSLRCLFMSGYTADAITHRQILEGGLHFLQKPFSMESLALKIREALAPDAG